jgi:hypothetical protein
VDLIFLWVLVGTMGAEFLWCSPLLEVLRQATGDCDSRTRVKIYRVQILKYPNGNADFVSRIGQLDLDWQLPPKPALDHVHRTCYLCNICARYLMTNINYCKSGHGARLLVSTRTNDHVRRTFHQNYWISRWVHLWSLSPFSRKPDVSTVPSNGSSCYV